MFHNHTILLSSILRVKSQFLVRFCSQTNYFPIFTNLTKKPEAGGKIYIGCNCKKSPNILVFYSDEKNFDQDYLIYFRNNCRLCAGPEEVLIVMSTLFPTTVVVLGVVSNRDDVMPPPPICLMLA